MAGKKGFEGIEPIFGEVKAEVEQPPSPSLLPSPTVQLRPFLFYVHSLDSSRLEVVASDFHSHTFARILTVHQLDDLRDDIGISGSWSEFVDYLIASLSSGNVQLSISGVSNVSVDCGEIHATLIAHKSKGLPRVSLPLDRLLSSSANDATAHFCLALFKAFKEKKHESLIEHEQCLQVKGLLSSEQERSERLQKQLDGLSFGNKRKMHRTKASHVTDSVPDQNTLSVSETQPPPLDNSEALQLSVISQPQQSSERAPVKDTQPVKASQKVAPVSRRGKTRGVSLRDAADDED